MYKVKPIRCLSEPIIVWCPPLCSLNGDLNYLMQNPLAALPIAKIPVNRSFTHRLRYNSLKSEASSAHVTRRSGASWNSRCSYFWCRVAEVWQQLLHFWRWDSPPAFTKSGWILRLLFKRPLYFIKGRRSLASKTWEGYDWKKHWLNEGETSQGRYEATSKSNYRSTYTCNRSETGTSQSSGEKENLSGWRT